MAPRKRYRNRINWLVVALVVLAVALLIFQVSRSSFDRLTPSDQVKVIAKCRALDGGDFCLEQKAGEILYRP